MKTLKSYVANHRCRTKVQVNWDHSGDGLDDIK